MIVERCVTDTFITSHALNVKIDFISFLKRFFNHELHRSHDWYTSVYVQFVFVVLHVRLV